MLLTFSDEQPWWMSAHIGDVEFAAQEPLGTNEAESLSEDRHDDPSQFRPRTLGQNGLLTVSDPWEFGTLNGVGPFRVQVRAVMEGDLVLLRLLDFPEFEGMTIQYLVGSPRYVGADLRNAATEPGLDLNLVPVRPPDIEAGRALESALAWRGWGLIGSLHLAD